MNLRVSAAQLVAAGKVARLFALDSVTLVELRMKRLQSFDDANTAAFSYKLQHRGTGVLSKDGLVLATVVSFKVVVRKKDGSEASDSEALIVNGSFALTYLRESTDPPVEQSDIDTFAKFNALYNAWPYMREVLASSISRMGYPSFTLAPLVISPPTPKPPSSAQANK